MGALLVAQAAYGVADRCELFFSSSATGQSTPSDATARTRYQLHREKIAALLSEKSVAAAGDMLHTYWQRTNSYSTRYKGMKDDSGKPMALADLQGYLSRSGIPTEYHEFYRPNKDGFLEEDIKRIPNRHLAPNNRAENTLGAEAAIRQVAELLISAPTTPEEADARIATAFQNIHTGWWKRNAWAQGSHPANAFELSADVQLINAYPVIAIFKREALSIPRHQLISEAFDRYVVRLNTQRTLAFKNHSPEDAYLALIGEKGFKIVLDPVLTEFFDSKLKLKEIAPIAESAPMDRQAEHYGRELRHELSVALGDPNLELVAPSTPPGSAAKVFFGEKPLRRSRGGAESPITQGWWSGRIAFVARDREISEPRTSWIEACACVGFGAAVKR